MNLENPQYTTSTKKNDFKVALIMSIKIAVLIVVLMIAYPFVLGVFQGLFNITSSWFTTLVLITTLPVSVIVATLLTFKHTFKKPIIIYDNKYLIRTTTILMATWLALTNGLIYHSIGYFIGGFIGGLIFVGLPVYFTLSYLLHSKNTGDPVSAEKREDLMIICKQSKKRLTISLVALFATVFPPILYFLADCTGALGSGVTCTVPLIGGFAASLAMWWELFIMTGIVPIMFVFSLIGIVIYSYILLRKCRNKSY